MMEIQVGGVFSARACMERIKVDGDDLHSQLCWFNILSRDKALYHTHKGDRPYNLAALS